MPYLKIKSIVCEIAEEDDKDEIYLMHKGKKIWPADKKFIKIDVDEALQIGLKVKISKPGLLKLELWEYDLTSKNDYLGDFHLEIKELVSGEYTEPLIKNDAGAERASYYLNWALVE